jgi:hypothetical protein
VLDLLRVLARRGGVDLRVLLARIAEEREASEREIGEDLLDDLCLVPFLGGKEAQSRGVLEPEELHVKRAGGEPFAAAELGKRAVLTRTAIGTFA